MRVFKSDWVKQKVKSELNSRAGVAGRGRPSWDGGGHRTVKNAGLKLFFRYVRFKDGGGPRTDKVSSKEDEDGKFLKSGRRCVIPLYHYI